jgi:hypothetical protein
MVWPPEDGGANPTGNDTSSARGQQPAACRRDRDCGPAECGADCGRGGRGVERSRTTKGGHLRRIDEQNTVLLDPEVSSNLGGDFLTACEAILRNGENDCRRRGAFPRRDVFDRVRDLSNECSVVVGVDELARRTSIGRDHLRGIAAGYRSWR